MEWVVQLFVCILLNVTFGGIAVFAFLSKNPINFWAGQIIKPEQVNNVKSYNRANGIMWSLFDLPIFAAAVLTPISSEVSAWVLAVGVLAGLPAVIIVYTKVIKRKYFK